ncbi:enoyl-CoA hydratase, partial [Streptomyces sp. SID7982]|nr:enoyl-CoA hydratase [Streptomyces sp. SID7982]
MTLIARTGERGIATLTLDSPANRNALSAALVGELRDALAACAADDTVRAVVLAHTGSTFCAGADLKAPPDPEAFVGLMREIVALPKPVVA